ncbi:MAG: hypothetical protein RL322_1748 [Pseudomonadota bacterium]|jgi:tRNA A37 threonylcarbamoyladenosine dehydratase
MVADAAERRFGGVQRLYGEAAYAAFAHGHVCVVGVGGVGSWSVEALARSAVGRLTLIDLDHVAESNINRQLPALGSTLGASKIEVMRARIADVAPGCVVDLIDDFVTVDNASVLVPADAVIIDAIDQPAVKAALVALAAHRTQPIVVCGAAGARRDPLSLRREDLALTRGDALLSAVRSRLRREYGFPREPGRRFGVPVIHSAEQPSPPPPICAPGDPDGPAGGPGAPLACGGYGSAVTVTAAMGFAATALALEMLAPRAAQAGRTAQAPMSAQSR